jgi:DnaK suppressor protein
MTVASATTHDSIRLLLTARRAEILAHADSVAADDAEWAKTAAAPEVRRELLAEGDSVAVERQMLAQLTASARVTLVDIDAALQRISAGTYGKCESCRTDIPAERLEIRPYATRCVACASRR